MEIETVFIIAIIYKGGKSGILRYVDYEVANRTYEELKDKDESIGVIHLSIVIK